MCKFGGRRIGLVFAVGAAVGLLCLPAGARTFVSVGIGFPGPGWYGPPPYVYAPPPAVVYAPPPTVVVAPPPTVYVTPSAPPPPQPAVWYYCDNPQGYYPYVSTCGTPWRQVQPPPAQ
jgi:hypothetical protein